VDPSNRNTALASAFVEELARCGLRRAVVSPGSRSTPLAVALWRQPAIDVQVVLDERSAAFVALGSALATRVPVAALCTSGSAAAHFHPAVVEADEASVPLILLTADRPPELRDIVFAASSMPVRDLEAFLPADRRAVRFLSNRGANGIDGLVSTAAGIAAGGTRTWAVLGDLALAHDIGGLAAGREAPSLRLIVIDNGGGGIFHFLPQAEAMPEPEFEALMGTPSGLDPARAAALYGLDAAVAGNPAELERALEGDAPVVVLRTDRRRNREAHRRLASVASGALASSGALRR
jgi:2-succinyl-5-enolpyruvyl-6-hydroxy-3-cyclohexene-1-carboxylate synthase